MFNELQREYNRAITEYYKLQNKKLKLEIEILELKLEGEWQIKMNEYLCGCDVKNNWWFATLIDFNTGFIQIVLSENDVDVDVNDYSYL